MNTSCKEYLLREARLHSMCTENIDALKSCVTKSDAINLYKKTIDWALEEGYPSIDFIRKEFGDCEDLGIFVDKMFHGEHLDEHQCYVFHNCRGHITVDLNIEKRIIPMLYFANGCEMEITRAASAHSLAIQVPIYIFGENKIQAEINDDIIFVIHEGGVR